MLLEFLDRIIMVEELWSSVLNGGCVWVTRTSSTRDEDGVEAKSMIDLVLAKKDMLRFVQDVRAVRGMGRGLSDHHIVLCKVKLVGTWIKRKGMVNGGRRIRSEKPREHQYREGYAKSLEWDGENNVKHMWEQEKRKVKRCIYQSKKDIHGQLEGR